MQKYALFPTGSIPTNKDFASMFCEVDNARQEGRRRIFLFSTKATGQANVCRDKDPPTLRAEKAAEPRFLLPAHLLCLIICQKRWINNAAIQSSAGT